MKPQSIDTITDELCQQRTETRKAPTLLYATTADVIAATRWVLKNEGVVEEDALKALVEDELTKNGFTCFGFAMRFKAACQDPHIIATPKGYRVAKYTECVYYAESHTVRHDATTSGPWTTYTTGTTQSSSMSQYERQKNRKR